MAGRRILIAGTSVIFNWMLLLNTCFVPCTLLRDLHTTHLSFSELYELVLSLPVWHLGRWDSENLNHLPKIKAEIQAQVCLAPKLMCSFHYFKLNKVLFLSCSGRDHSSQLDLSSQLFLKDQGLMAIFWGWDFKAVSLCFFPVLYL